MVGKLLVIVGPTAVGKTALSLLLAEAFGGEIVSADSRLFYRGLDVGTAKPSLEERERVPHHLIDICAPNETLTLGEYQRLAYLTIGAVHARGRLPILAGGTGQYVMAVVEGWGIPKVPPQPGLRKALGKLGGEELARWLRALDPQAAGRIDSRNVRRVVRALEVTLRSGKPISTLQAKTPPPYDMLVLGLEREREMLYRRIDQRVDDMLAAGLLEEVRALQKAGFGRTPAMSGLGYRQLMAHQEGELTLEEAVQRIKFETHRFARQQKTWFQPDDPRIHWFVAEGDEVVAPLTALVKAWLERPLTPGFFLG